jgi:endonuclease-3
LTAHASPFNSAVTLFQADDQSIPRRSKRVKLEESILADLEDTITDERDQPLENSAKKTANAKISRSPTKRKPIPQTLKTPHPAPVRWREAYDAIKNMRSHIIAPVDTMGCDQAQLKEADPKVSFHFFCHELTPRLVMFVRQNQRFSTLVSLMLSSQTKDEVTDAAVSKLREAVGGSLSVDAILAVEDSVIAEAIGKVGFWRRKTQSVMLES